MDEILLYVGSVVIAGWGIAHFFPTRGVVKAFGPISEDNKRIITMEWIAEGVALCFVGLLVLFVTILEGADNPVAVLVQRASALMLLVMAVLSLLTGARTAILPMKMCPIVFTVVAVLFFLAGLI